MARDVWILGASGRSGRAIARRLADRGLSLVLVGRDVGRLAELVRETPNARAVPAGTFEEALAAVSQAGAVVVMNTVGPFATTAPRLARACAPGSACLDLSNELYAALDVLGLHEAAVASGTCLVTGAGYGIVAAESVVRRLCADRPPPADVRVDAIPWLSEGGRVVGEALAATIVDSVAAAGRRYTGARWFEARRSRRSRSCSRMVGPCPPVTSRARISWRRSGRAGRRRSRSARARSRAGGWRAR